MVDRKVLTAGLGFIAVTAVGCEFEVTTGEEAEEQMEEMQEDD